MELAKSNNLFSWLNENPNLNGTQVTSTVKPAIQQAHQDINKAQETLHIALTIMTKELVQYFSENTKTEWIDTHITPLSHTIAGWRKRIEELSGP